MRDELKRQLNMKCSITIRTDVESENPRLLYHKILKVRGYVPRLTNYIININIDKFIKIAGFEGYTRVLNMIQNS